MITKKTIQIDKLNFDIAYLTDKGGRPVNEDSVAVSQGKRSILFAVADGLGAHGGGDIASSAAIERAEREYDGLRWVFKKKIAKIFNRINDTVISHHTGEIHMKTTLSCVWYRKRRLYCAHLGDTRIYVFRNGEIDRITADHTFAYDAVMRNGGTLDDLRNNPNRHMLSAALGVRGMKPPASFSVKAQSGTELLICSDGFWEYVTEADMTDTLSKSSDAHDWLDRMMKLYSDRAAVYSDNYSAVCVKINQYFSPR